MRVLVIFEFEDVEVNSESANTIVQQITDSTENMRVAFDAQGCWVQEVFQEDNNHA